MGAGPLCQLPTPALLLDWGVMTRNTARMADRAAELSVLLRPHGKTPKSPDIAKVLTARQAKGLCVSTLLEAEQYFASGIDDLFYSTALGPSKAERAASLLERGARLSCLLDDPSALPEIAAIMAARGQTLPVMIEIAVDDYRSGVPVTDDRFRVLLQELTTRDGVKLAGIMSYAGASYGLHDIAAVQALTETHRQALASTRDVLRTSGIAVERVSLGSTPAILHARTLEGITEARCGIYVFQDLMQAAIGACRIEDIAVSVLAEIISVQPHLGRFIIDAGALALSKDRSTANSPHDAGYGLVADAQTGAILEGLYVSQVSQELGVVTARGPLPLDTGRFQVGDRVRVLPNHADMTAAAYTGYHVLQKPGASPQWLARFNHW